MLIANSKFMHYQEDGTMLVLVLAAQCTPISMSKLCNYTYFPWLQLELGLGPSLFGMGSTYPSPIRCWV